MAKTISVIKGGSSSGIPDLGNGLATAFGLLVAKVTSGLTFDGSGNIIVKNGSGIAIDGTGHVTVNQGVGLGIDGSGFLVVQTGTGLSTSGGSVFIPGGAITNALLAVLSVATANIQSGAVGTTQIAAASITTALIANAAITNALLGTAVVGTANIQNAAITTALIANLAVGNAQINDLAANKITAGTISATVSMTSPNITSSSGGSTVSLTNGSITVQDASSLATLQSGILTIVMAATAFALHQSDLSAWANGSGITIVSCSSSTGVRVNNSSGTNRISLTDSAANFTSCPIQVGGTTVVDSSRNGALVGLTTSAAYTASHDIILNAEDHFLTVDASGAHRLGMTKKNGSNPFVTFGSGIEFVIAQSGGTDIAASNSFTEKFAIDSSGHIRLGGNTGYTGTLAAAIAGAANVFGGIIY